MLHVAAEDAVLLPFVIVKVLVTPEMVAPIVLLMELLADAIDPQLNIKFP